MLIDSAVAAAARETERVQASQALAALTAALMSTADTLVTAVSAIFLNDIYRPYIKRNATDRHYLVVARFTSLTTCVLGMLLVPIYLLSDTIYGAHGMFTAAVTPPIVVAIQPSPR